MGMKGPLLYYAPFLTELIIRFGLFQIFWIFEGEKAEACHRVIRSEEIWLYSYPRKDSYVPTWLLWTEVFTVGPVLIFIMYLWFRDRADLKQAIWSYTLACLLNGAIVNIMKVCAGRPRPDFFFRCHPNAEFNSIFWDNEEPCTGLKTDVTEGRKSFPSGHSSWSFTVTSEKVSRCVSKLAWVAAIISCFYILHLRIPGKLSEKNL